MLALLGAGVLFLGGFLAGRLNDDSGVNIAQEAAPSAPAQDDGEAGADESSSPEALRANVGAGTSSNGSLGQGDVEAVAATVEAIEAELAKIDLTSVTFVRGTDELADGAQETLRRVADVLIENPSIPVEVETSTFTEPTPGENHGLSVLQAQAIASFLIDQGVDGNRLVIVGLGSPFDAGLGQETLLLFDSENAGLAADLARLDPTAFELVEDDDISVPGQTMLEQMSRLLQAHPGASVRLIGYSSARSESESHDRSHLVVDSAARYLTELGIDGSRLVTVGMGNSPRRVDVATVVKLEVGFSAAASAMNQVVTEQLTFLTGTSEFTDSGLEAIVALAEAMSVDPASKVEISVHTYTEADSDLNHELSRRQGGAIGAALAGLGIDADRIVVLGHGDPPQFAEPGRDTYISLNPID